MPRKAARASPHCLFDGEGIIIVAAREHGGSARMRLLFLNPNTSAALTAAGARLAREVARPDTHIVPATGRFGARYIRTRAAAAIAGHAALDAFARKRRDADVVLLACCGDPGLLVFRLIHSVPATNKDLPARYGAMIATG